MRYRSAMALSGALDISDVMEYVLLGEARIAAEGLGIEAAAKVGVNCALHPHVDGKGLEIGKAEERNAGCDLVADALDLL